MPRKIGVFSKKRDYILNLLDEGWDFRTIAAVLRAGKEKTSHQNLHKAYQRYLKKQKQCVEAESVVNETLESYVRVYHPKVFKEWLAYGRAAAKQMPPVKKGAAKKIDVAAVDRLWECVKEHPTLEKLGRDKLADWVNEASENSAARKRNFQQVSRILEREYADGNLSATHHTIVKGWVEFIFYDSPEAALAFVNDNVGKSFDEWNKSFETALQSISERSH